MVLCSSMEGPEATTACYAVCGEERTDAEVAEQPSPLTKATADVAASEQRCRYPRQAIQSLILTLMLMCVVSLHASRKGKLLSMINPAADLERRLPADPASIKTLASNVFMPLEEEEDGLVAPPVTAEAPPADLWDEETIVALNASFKVSRLARVHAQNHVADLLTRFHRRLACWTTDSLLVPMWPQAVLASNATLSFRSQLLRDMESEANVRDGLASPGDGLRELWLLRKLVMAGW